MSLIFIFELMETLNFQDNAGLPDGFAENLLELEMKIDKHCEVDTIKSLVDLYSVFFIQIAIEYYESIKDSKYLAYHKRLQTLLLRDDVQIVLNATVKAASRKPLSDLSANSLYNVEFHLLETSQDSSLSRSQAINNIKKQEDGIESKLKARKSLRMAAIDNKIDADKSAGTVDEFQNALVNIMEKYLIAKLTQVEAVRSLYENQMQEIRDMGDSVIIREILKEMQSSMNIEIDRISKKIDSEKNEAISKLRDESFFSSF